MMMKMVKMKLVMTEGVMIMIVISKVILKTKLVIKVVVITELC